MQKLVEMLSFKLNLKGDNTPKLDECLYIIINRLPDKVLSQTIDDVIFLTMFINCCFGPSDLVIE